MALIALATIGFVALNGAFLYGAIARPAALRDAMRNPVSLAFMVEAMILVGLCAYLLERARATRLRSWAFIALSLIGGLAFSIPVALLMPRADS